MTTPHIDINEIAKQFMDNAKLILENEGFINPVVFIHNPQGTSPPFPIQAIPKAVVSQVINKMIELFNGDYVVMVTDTWIAVNDNKAPMPSGPVKDMPNKQDALVVMIKTKDGQANITTSIYKKENDTYVYEDVCHDLEPFINVFLDGVFENNTIH